MEYLKIAAIPLFLTAAGMAIIRFRKLSLRDDVGFKSPASQAVLLWMAIFIAWAAAGEYLASGSGPTAWGSWRGRYDATQIAVRIGAIGLVYPIIEEFFFRGVFLGVVRCRFGNVLAVLVPAMLFGLVHTQYDWPIWIVGDGILFGICRIHSGSVYLPMLLHAIGNSYALWERLQ